MGTCKTSGCKCPMKKKPYEEVKCTKETKNGGTCTGTYYKYFKWKGSKCDYLGSKEKDTRGCGHATSHKP
ncbi:uncharacterized protein CTRU02_206892 [Colletotrichum truncatum]|uniref:Uncharacterized protein n=1 Tax=Colletotrichum truncatum TaxID=5467 RepID=A0ACC3YZN2_COLTU|nr:uncharacterized protein CTRU02_15387 [Colletotrichum truncatum]KAF6781107.1 hypothetical protein CTRU02_15387 [Colletotrichum truncatum]